MFKDRILLILTKNKKTKTKPTILDTVNTTEYILTSSNDDPCNETTVYVSGINGLVLLPYMECIFGVVSYH